MANTVSSFPTSLTRMQLLPFLFSLRLQPAATSMSLSKVCESIEQCPHGCLCLAPSFFHSLTGLLRYFPPPNPFSSPSRCRVTSQTRSRGGSSQRCALTSDLRMTLFLFFFVHKPYGERTSTPISKCLVQVQILLRESLRCIHSDRDSTD